MIDVLGFVRKLQEHALKRKIVIQKIDSLQMPIRRHLMNIALFPHHQAVNHWKEEVLNWFFDISEMEVKGKGVLKEKQYFELLYEQPWTPLRSIEKGIKSRLNMYKDIKPCLKDIKSKAIKIDKEVKNLFKQLSKDFALGTFDYGEYEERLEEFRKTFLGDCND